MAFIRLEENLSVNTQYIIKVKWKSNPETDELSATVFLAIDDKNAVITTRGESALNLWDALHANEDPPSSGLPISKVTLKSVRRSW
ncbi:hypothetical protein [Phormidesmis priestleyi]